MSNFKLLVAMSALSPQASLVRPLIAAEGWTQKKYFMDLTDLVVRVSWLILFFAHGCYERIRSGEVSANIEDAGGWVYFSGRVVNMTREETSLSIRLVYKGEHTVMVRACLRLCRA